MIRWPLLSFIAIAPMIAIAMLGSASAQPRRAVVSRHPAPSRGKHPAEEFEKMAPAEREKALAKLPPERQQKLREKLARWDKLSPEERDRQRAFNSLPPERKDAVRHAYQQFQKFPPERQVAIRDELQQLHEMTDPERRQRLAAPEFKQKFNKPERETIEDMTGVTE
jgi:DNA-directed RNA polymerase subunit F